MILSSQKIPSVSLTRNLNSSEFQTDLFPQNEKANEDELFYEIINSKFPIKAFEILLNTKRNSLYLPHFPFIILNELIQKEFKWKYFNFPHLTYIYLYNKAKIIKPKIISFANKHNINYSSIIESYNPNKNKTKNHLWIIPPKEVYNSYCKLNLRQEINLEEKMIHDSKVTNIFVNFKKFCGNKLPQLIFMGKTCNLYIENKNIYDYNDSNESIINDKCTSNKIIKEFYYNNSVVYDHDSKRKSSVSSNYRTLGDCKDKLKTSYSQLFSPKFSKGTQQSKMKFNSPFSVYTNTLNTINMKVTSPKIKREISFSPNRQIILNNKQHKLTFHGINKNSNKHKENKNMFLKLEKKRISFDRYKLQKSDFFF